MLNLFRSAEHPRAGTTGIDFLVVEPLGPSGERILTKTPATDVAWLDVQVLQTPGANPDLPKQREPWLRSGGPGTDRRVGYPTADLERIEAASPVVQSVLGPSGAEVARVYVVRADLMFPKGPAGQSLPPRLRPSSIDAPSSEVPEAVIDAQRAAVAENYDAPRATADLTSRRDRHLVAALCNGSDEQRAPDLPGL